MIRIDELYNNTFWPWLRKNRPGFREFFCDPFGRSDPDSIISYGNENIKEHNYIFFFDQEPIHLNIHTKTFNRVYGLNLDLFDSLPVQDITQSAVKQRNPYFNLDYYIDRTGELRNKTHNVGHLITSERDSENVESVCKTYKWKSLYYFFHGWAALDWYRGYDRTFLITPPSERKITKTFVAPNRIIAGERQHRLEMLYHVFKNKLIDNHISCPDVCPAEDISIYEAIKPLTAKYPDIETVFANTALPMHFRGETDHPMHSCWLSLFDECAESLLYLVTETVATGRRHHLTEKTFKPICLRMPFVIVGTCGSLKYLRSYGFKTFGDFWDESYDNIQDDSTRIAAIAEVLKQLDLKTRKEKQELFNSMQEVIEHNYIHFYKGAFEDILWVELMGMLNAI